MYKTWHQASVLSHSTLIVADGQVWVGSPNEKDLDSIEQLIRRGESPLDLLGAKPVHLNEHQLVSIESMHNDDEINFAYKTGRDKHTTSVVFPDRAARDEAMSLLESTLRLKKTIVEYSPLRAAVGPLGFLAATVFFTYVFAGAAAEMAAGKEGDIHGRNRLLKLIFVWVASVIGPTGMYIIGAIVAALCVFALIHRIKDPPVITKLTPK